MTKTIKKVGKGSLVKGTLKIGARIYQSEAVNPVDLILSFNPETYRGVGVLTLEKGERRVEKIIPSRLAFKLWGPASGTMKQIAIKQVNDFYTSII